MKRLICSFLAAVISLTALTAVPAGAAVLEKSTVTTSAETKLPSPKNYKKSSTATTVTISWDKVDGASAYKVYMFDEVLDEYTAYKTVKNPTVTVKGLDKSTKYKFKIQTLTKVNGKYVKQKKSGTISVTTKENDLPTAPSNNYTGWGKDSDSHYYFKKGKLCSGLQKIGQDYYYFTEDGYLMGWLNNKEIYYYFGKTGKMARNKTLTIGGNDYEFESNGALVWYDNTVKPTAKYTVEYEEPNLDIYISPTTDEDTNVVGMELTNNGTKPLIIDNLGQLSDSEYTALDRLLTLVDNSTGELTFPDTITLEPGETRLVFYATLPDSTWYDKKSTIKWYAQYDGVNYVFYSSNYFGSYYYSLHFELIL